MIKKARTQPRRSARHARSTAPVADWYVVLAEDPEPKIIRRQGITKLAEVAGWTVTATLSTTPVAKGARRIDTFIVTAVKGRIEVRTQAHQVDGAAPVELALLQVSTTSRPLLTIAAASRPTRPCARALRLQVTR